MYTHCCEERVLIYLPSFFSKYNNILVHQHTLPVRPTSVELTQHQLQQYYTDLDLVLYIGEAKKEQRMTTYNLLYTIQLHYDVHVPLYLMREEVMMVMGFELCLEVLEIKGLESILLFVLIKVFKFFTTS